MEVQTSLQHAAAGSPFLKTARQPAWVITAPRFQNRWSQVRFSPGVPRKTEGKSTHCSVISPGSATDGAPGRES